MNAQEKIVKRFSVKQKVEYIRKLPLSFKMQDRIITLISNGYELEIADYIERSVAVIDTLDKYETLNPETISFVYKLLLENAY